MKSIDLMYQTMLAELGQRSLDAAWTATPALYCFLKNSITIERISRKIAC
jgi:hypothetical protein